MTLSADEKRRRETARHARWLSKNRDRVKAARIARGETLWQKHRLRPADLAAMRESQDNRCYLCGGELSQSNWRIDHDHRCCPPLKSCSRCRRGIACNNCNLAIGFVADDPSRLRRMADALEAASLAVESRMKSHPAQAAMW
jgi:Recombination endonuclease VII